MQETFHPVRTHRTVVNSIWLALSSVLLVVPHNVADDGRTASRSNEPYALGPQLRVLAQDLTSREYRDVLATMIPTDLAAEWLRVATPDNYVTFREKHGGAAKVSADADLSAAYRRRKQIAEGFLDLMRQFYERRRKDPPFEAEGELEELLARAGDRKVSGSAALDVPLKVVMPAPGSEWQWPRLRGPTGQGTAIEAELPLTWGVEENIVWRAGLPGKGNSSPVVWGERLFITAASEDGRQRQLLCYHRADGRLLWKRAAPAAATQEMLYWKNSYASSTPVTDGQRVISFFGNSGLVCWDTEGHLEWRQSLGEFTTTHGPGTSPVLYKDKVIFIQDQNRGDSVFVALDKQTGEKLWQQERESAMCWSTPVVVRVDGRDELIYNGSHHVIGYDPNTGEELWRVSGTTREAIPMVVVGGGLIYSTSGRNGPTLAIRPGGRGDVTETHVRWQTLRGGPHVPSPVYHDGRLFLVNDTGIVTSLDARDGALIWQRRLRGRFSMSPIEADGRLLLTNEDGRTYILEASDEFEVVAENDLGEYTVATPAVLGGRLYFRTASQLICVGEVE